MHLHLIHDIVLSHKDIKKSLTTLTFLVLGSLLALSVKEKKLERSLKKIKELYNRGLWVFYMLDLVIYYLFYLDKCRKF